MGLKGATGPWIWRARCVIRRTDPRPSSRTFDSLMDADNYLTQFLRREVGWPASVLVPRPERVRRRCA